MESFENKNTDKEPTREQLHSLVLESYSRALKIVRKNQTESNYPVATVSATTQEAEDHYKYGRLTVIHHNNEIDVKLNETSDVTSEENTTERFHIAFSKDTNRYELEVTGVQPDISDDLLDSEGTEEEYELAKNNAEEYIHEQFHAPSAADVQRLHDILELGLYGDELFNHERFEIQYEQYLDDLEMIKDDADLMRDQNENHPE